MEKPKHLGEICLASYDAPAFETVVGDEFACFFGYNLAMTQCPYLGDYLHYVKKYQCKYRKAIELKEDLRG